MRYFYILFIPISFIFISFYSMEPSFNGDTPGCAGGGCHSLSEGVTTAVYLGNLQIEVTVHGVNSGDNVGGELVDASDVVVDVINSTATNPFILTAPSAGNFRVNAGFKKPDRLWDSTSVTVTVSSLTDEESSNKPRTFRLLQNHPNPFNGGTIIRFELEKSAYSKLTIFNTQGQIVRHLADRNFSAGIHTLLWDGLNDQGIPAPSGIYIYQIQSGQNIKAKRMILAK